jgi:hypothetical protein
MELLWARLLAAKALWAVKALMLLLITVMMNSFKVLLVDKQSSLETC